MMKNRKFNVKAAAGAIIAVMSIAAVTGCGVSQPCTYCGEPATKVYYNRDSTGKEVDCAVCKECSSKCMFCGADSTRHYTATYSGLEVFVCDDCYAGMMQMGTY